MAYVVATSQFTLVQLKKALYIFYRRWDVNRHSRFKQKTRDDLGVEYPDFGKEQEKLKNIMTALAHCKEWHPQRKWLLNNGVNIANMPEEVLYQEYQTQFQFVKKAKRVKLQEDIWMASQKLTLMKQQRIKQHLIKSLINKQYSYLNSTKQPTQSKEYITQVSKSYLKQALKTDNQIKQNKLYTIIEENEVTKGGDDSEAGLVELMELQENGILKDNKMKGLVEEQGEFEYGEHRIAEMLGHLQSEYVDIGEKIPKKIADVVKLEKESYGRTDIDEKADNGPFSLQFLVDDDAMHSFKDEIVNIMDDDYYQQRKNEMNDLGLVQLIGGDQKNGL